MVGDCRCNQEALAEDTHWLFLRPAVRHVVLKVNGVEVSRHIILRCPRCRAIRRAT